MVLQVQVAEPPAVLRLGGGRAVCRLGFNHWCLEIKFYYWLLIGRLCLGSDNYARSVYAKRSTAGLNAVEAAETWLRP